MAWAEEQHWFGLEPDSCEEIEHRNKRASNKRIQMLNDYFHEDKFGRIQDVRLIEPRYAFNLYNWYLRRNYMPEEDMKKTTMMRELSNRFKYENF